MSVFKPLLIRGSLVRAQERALEKPSEHTVFTGFSASTLFLLIDSLEPIPKVGD